MDKFFLTFRGITCQGCRGVDHLHDGDWGGGRAAAAGEQGGARAAAARDRTGARENSGSSTPSFPLVITSRLLIVIENVAISWFAPLRWEDVARDYRGRQQKPEAQNFNSK